MSRAGRPATGARRAAYLRAMGLTPWVGRDQRIRDHTEAVDTDSRAPVAEPPPVAAPEAAGEGAAGARADDRARSTSADTDGAEPTGVSPGLSSTPAGQVAPEAVDWEGLAAEIARCTACALHQGRTRTVPGVGDVGSDWLVVGEAPGVEEDRQGEPFVGRAGKLLDNILAAIDIGRSRGCYITNIVKCRPPRNRDPRPEEADACAGYLERQIAWLRPKIILAAGRVAAQNLLATDRPVGRLRGRAHRYRDTDIPIVVTYHPAYLLRSPAQKRRVWEDLKLARDLVEGRRA